MNYHSIRYMVLRDQRRWEESTSFVGLVPRTDGALQLSGLPGIAAGAVIQLPAPFDTKMSGVACGENRTTYCTISNEVGQLIIAQCGCSDYEVINAPTDTGQAAAFKFPRGLLIVGEKLLVADSGKSRVLVLGLP